MQQEGTISNKYTFIQVINACAGLGSLQDGRHVHEQIIQSGCQFNVFTVNSLVDMYAKCGSMEDAWRVFKQMPSCDGVSWSAMLGGCALHDGKEALTHFEQMCEEDVLPNDITSICLLSACSHAGMVDEGMRCYTSMITVYIISAKLEHYTCMIDLLGCAGHPQEAENTIKVIPCKPRVAAWRALLGASRIHGNVEMECIAEQVPELEPENAAGYVQLSNIYAAVGNKHLCENVKQQRKERGVKKQLECTWIEVNNEVHTFVLNSQDHPQTIEICAELKRLSGLRAHA
jgi:pentatricopeptide repeat protein